MAGDSGTVELTLYGRGYCHLCDDMKLALEPLRREFAFHLHEIDVDADPETEARFNELVPVLMAGPPSCAAQALGDQEELCHHFLDLPKVREWLAQHAAVQPATGK